MTTYEFFLAISSTEFYLLVSLVSPVSIFQQVSPEKCNANVLLFTSCFFGGAVVMDSNVHFVENLTRIRKSGPTPAHCFGKLEPQIWHVE